MNNGLSKALRAVLVGTLMLVSGTDAMADGVVVHGSVYGGGKGKADNFTCDKAMVGVVEQGVDETVEGEGDDAVTTYTLREGGTTVTIRETPPDDSGSGEGSGEGSGGGQGT